MYLSSLNLSFPDTFQVFIATVHSNYVDCNRWLGDFMLSKVNSLLDLIFVFLLSRIQNQFAWGKNHIIWDATLWCLKHVLPILID